MEYGIEINNKFAMFLDDDECADPLEVLQRNEEAAAKQKKLDKENAAKNVGKGGSKTSTKNAKPAAKVQSSAIPVEQAKNKTNQDFPKKEIIGDKPPRFANRQKENRTIQQTETDGGNQAPRRENANPPRFNNDFNRDRVGNGDSRGEEFRGRGGFRRGGRGGQGRGEGRGGFSNEGGFDRFGKREYDRHSGSDKGGMKPVDKREGGGAHNWGTITDDIDEQLKPAESVVGEQTEKVDTERNGETAAPAESTEADTAVAGDEPVEEKQMTLDEWKNLQEQNKVKATFNVRQANEGCNDPTWKKMFQLKKKGEDEEEEEEEEEEDDEQHGKHKTVIPISITFNDSDRYGGGNSRGRGRGGRGGYGPRGGSRGGMGGAKQQSNKEAPNVADESDFPSLG